MSFAVRQVSDSSILIEAVGLSLEAANHFVHSFSTALFEHELCRQVTNIHPAYQNILVDFNPQAVSPKKLIAALDELCHQAGQFSSQTLTVHEIDVSYGGDFGPDLDEVALYAQLSTGEVVKIHSEPLYTVAFIGFSPGFPYLLGLNESLHCRRKTSPRVRVPQGSVGLAGFQTGIYPHVSPGGWQIIGQTERELFNVNKNPPSLFKAGDRVKFVSRLKRSARSSTQSLTQSLTPAVTSSNPVNSFILPDARAISTGELTKMHIEPIIQSFDPCLEIIETGPFTSIQDLGRYGLSHFGISPGGAADPVSLRVGNTVVGNKPNAAALELTSHTATVRFLADTWICVSGASCTPKLDQQPIEMWTALPVSCGQHLSLSTATEGLRSYLHLHRGVGGQKLLGSRSLDISAKFGGHYQRPLATGDLIYFGHEAHMAPRFRRATSWFVSQKKSEQTQLRVTLGPQSPWFKPESLKLFFDQNFEVTDQHNRLGVRLTGAMLERLPNTQPELLSEGIAYGSIQVAADQNPMILFCEQQTTGGYPKIATVIRADWAKIGQLKATDRVRFINVTLEEAHKINQGFESQLAQAVEDF